MTTVSSSTVFVGDTLTFTLKVTNLADPAAGVMVADTLPSGLNYVSATPTQGSCSQSAGTMSCDLGALAAVATASISLVVNGASPGTYTNTASVIGDATDVNPDDNAASVNVTVQLGDTTPNPFHFQDQSLRLPLLPTYASNRITVSGINSNAPIIIVGGSDAMYSINGGAFTRAAGTVHNGDQVQLRNRIPLLPLAPKLFTANATLTIGGVSDTWTLSLLP